MTAYIAIIIVSVIFGLVATKQQQTIDRLTNKLMAKDYREYVSVSQPQPAPHVDDEEPKTWFDQ